MAFSELFLDELVRRNDIVDVVSQYVHLTRKAATTCSDSVRFTVKRLRLSVNIGSRFITASAAGREAVSSTSSMRVKSLTWMPFIFSLSAGLTFPTAPSQEVRSRRAAVGLKREAARFCGSQITGRGRP